MSERVKIAIVGAGRIAQTYAQVFAHNEEAEVVGVADIRPDAARAMAEMLNCESFSSYKQMASMVQMEAAVVCTPPASHPEVCRFLLERGVHVLCEKPLSVDSKSAQEMIAVAERNGVILTMASKFRYVEDVVRAKSILLSGILGELVLAETSFTSRVDMGTRWNSDPAIAGGGVLIDNGSHALDIFRYMVGPIADIQVIEGKRSQGLRVDETVHIFVRSTGGVMGSIDLSWSINKEQDSYINIYGSHGTVMIGWKESRYRQASSPEWVVFGRGYKKLDAFDSQISNFARAIRGREALLVTAEDALASVQAVETAYASLSQNLWTSLRVNGSLLPKKPILISAQA